MPSTSEIARGVASRLGDAALVDKLAGLKPSELTSLLLAVLAEQARARPFAELRRHFERAPATQPCDVDGRALARAERLLHEAAPGFDAVELAPVAPLGLCAATGIDPNNVLGALRSLEVLADPTASLALEVARRRRAVPGASGRRCGC